MTPGTVLYLREIKPKANDGERKHCCVSYWCALTKFIISFYDVVLFRRQFSRDKLMEESQWFWWVWTGWRQRVRQQHRTTKKFYFKEKKIWQWRMNCALSFGTCKTYVWRPECCGTEIQGWREGQNNHDPQTHNLEITLIGYKKLIF